METFGKPKRVALIIDTMMAPRRTAISGIARFIQEHEPWSVYLKPPFVDSALVQWLKHWHGDGVIGRLTRREVNCLKSANIPFVETGAFEQGEDFCVVRADDFRIGVVGAEHLLERGFKNFAFVEIADAFWARRRFEGFRDTLKARGFETDRHAVPKPSSGSGGPAAWEKQQLKLAEWIRSLPKPLGIMTTTDYFGRQVLEACQRIGAAVPDVVAVLGADNDEPICRISAPPLSSVIIDDERRGYEAARVLSELMNGRAPMKNTLLVSPSGVKTRTSTDVFAFEDPLMVAAMKHLRDNVEKHTTVDHVAEALGISRSTLDRKFRRVIGRSVNDEIVSLRINHALRLVSETQLPLKVIAMRCGFSSQAYMSTVFRAKLGRTPNLFRQ